MRHSIQTRLAVVVLLAASAASALAQGLAADEFEARRRELRDRYAKAASAEEKAVVLKEFQALQLAQSPDAGKVDDAALVEALMKGAGEVVAATGASAPDAGGTGLGSKGDQAIWSDEEMERILAHLKKSEEDMQKWMESKPWEKLLVTETPSRIRRRELAGKFEVGTGLARKPNALAQAEFDKAAQLHESLFQGDENVTIDTTGLSPEDAQKYKKGVMDLFAALLQTASGRSLLEYLNYGYVRAGRPVDRKVVIRLGKDGNGNGNRFDDVAQRAEPVDNQAATMKDEKGTPGAGSDSVVEFNPFATSDRADVVLMHELVHALMHTWGEDDYRSVSFEDGVPPDVSGTRPLGRYEHQAVGLGLYKNRSISENAYRRERRQIGAGGVGALPGDAEMQERHSYRVHTCGPKTCGR